MDDVHRSPPLFDPSLLRSPLGHSLPRLLHRWLFEYNPLYLVSAALVLVGVILSSQGLAGRGTLAQLGITGIAEVYAWALIGGAALLVRIRLRRPAVMLALLAALYQCDLTLHTETCAYLGLAGALGSVGWLVGFVAKLRALCWAMKLRLSRSAFGVATFGAAMIALLPWAFRALDGPAASSLLGAWVFALFAAGAWTSRRITSDAIDTEWAVTVARRSFRAVWTGWATMVLLHVGFWLSQEPTLSAHALAPAAVLLATRLLRRESRVWWVVAGTLGYVALALPSVLWLVAGMAAVVLGLHALRRPVTRPAVRAAPVPPAGDVYRVDPTLEPPPVRPQLPHAIFTLAPGDSRRRLLTGAVGCVYLAAWTYHWAGGPWPSHLWWLDLLLLAVSVTVVVHTRFYALLALPGLMVAHLVVSLDLVPIPQSILQWGLSCVGVGFVLLLGSLGASVRWRHHSVLVGRGPQPRPGSRR
ncbi:MAG: hypothetical protein AAGF11_12900 [Myxococcota bacterium]